MTPEKAELLRTKIKERLLDANNHLTALVHNAGKVGVDFDRGAFEQAWDAAPDSDERALGYAIEAACMDLVNGLVQAGQDVCTLNGWTNTTGRDLTKPEVLRQLEENGLIGETLRKRFGDICEFRDKAQHDHIGITAQRLHEHVTATLETGPDVLRALSTTVS